MRIVLTGGGTGGHLTPFAPLIEALRMTAPEPLELTFMGVVNQSVRDFFTQYDVPVAHVPAGKLRRYTSALTIIDLLFRLPIGIILALAKLFWIMPDVVLSKSGYASVPVMMAAVFYRIPVLLHESDAAPSLTTRRLARAAAAIGVGFAATREALPQVAHKVFVVGVPARRQLTLVTRAEARHAFSLPESENVLLVMGGSQGAAQINEALLQILPALIIDMAIIHVTGHDHLKKISTVARKILATSPRRAFYKPFGYLSDTLPHALVAADVVVARAGATTLAELAMLHKPALLIPYPSAANDHQRRNALVFEHAGAARVLDPNNVNPTLFDHSIRQLMADQSLRERMSQAMASVATPNAAREMAELTFKLAAGFRPTRT